MILQTGMRTDIPAFYAEWFANRVKEGYVLTRNPYNPKFVTKYLIDPHVVDVIGFCSKNPGPMLKYMDILQPYGQYWFVTITPYGKDIEANVPPVRKVIEDFRSISSIVGKNAIAWRYDPIIVNDVYTVDRHVEAFERIASELRGYTSACVISFVDLYEKVKRNYPECRKVSVEEQIQLIEAMVRIGKENGMEIRPCSEDRYLESFGANCGGCMTQEIYEKALGRRMKIPRQTPLREGCHCILGHDIGQYDTCGHLCRYCYANNDREAVKRNMRLHDPKSPLLVGHIQPEDEIHEAVQVSWMDDRMSIFDFM